MKKTPDSAKMTKFALDTGTTVLISHRKSTIWTAKDDFAVRCVVVFSNAQRKKTVNRNLSCHYQIPSLSRIPSLNQIRSLNLNPSCFPSLNLRTC